MLLIITLLACTIALALIMALAWVLQQRTGNSGWVDTAWSFGIGLCGLAGALMALLDPQSNGWRILIAASIAGAWSLRLGLHISTRSANMKDDPRYAELSRQWGDDAPRKMFIFLQQQAWVSAPLVWAIILAAFNPSPGLRLVDYAAILLAIVAVGLEHVSDSQLRAFARNPTNKGQVCDRGLWSLSRHPNYFFQWLGWLVWPLLAIDWSGGFHAGWLSLIAPVLMYVLLTHVTGIPPLEEHMLRKYGEQYRAYQRVTPAFFPTGKKPGLRSSQKEKI